MSFENPSAESTEQKLSPEKLREMQEKVKDSLHWIHLGLRAGIINELPMKGRGMGGQEPITSGTWYETSSGFDVRWNLPVSEKEGERAEPRTIELNRATTEGLVYVDQNDHKVKTTAKEGIKPGDQIGRKEYLILKNNGEATYTSRKVFATNVEGSYKELEDENATIYSNADGTRNSDKVLEKMQYYYSESQRQPKVEISKWAAF